MTRWKLTIEYDGTPFSGWQAQAGCTTVQGVLEEALHKFSGERAELAVAGRTDAGVHAAGQVAHVDLLRDTTVDEIQGALNFHVKPHPIAVLNVEAVAPEFHARFDAKQRHYRYRLINRRAPLALEAGRALHVAHRLDVAAMDSAAKLLLGNHDFSTFRAADCQGKSPIKTLDAVRFDVAGEVIDFHVSARSFLYHQIRNMIGSLLFVGSGKWTVADFEAAFKAADRTKGGPTAPPDGLCFMRVDY
ncbi:MAG: tRNA pseudouridine(38-40) synthase TruA [Bdellovibrionales bacterium]